MAPLLLVAACGSESEPVAVEPGPADFVGSTACANCHEVEYDDWLGSHHELAMQVANASSVLGNFSDSEFEYFGKKTSFTNRNGKYYVSTENKHGEQQEFRVDYAFGVTPLQQYLVEFPGGRLQALPFAWDSRDAADGGQRWYHLYPDEYIGPGDELHWTGRYQNWNYMCAECHSTNLVMGYDATSKTFDTTYSELSVGCEACHGPGSEHQSQAVTGSFDDQYGLAVALDDNDQVAWIMNPDTGIAERSAAITATSQQPESCGRCHSRRGVIAAEYEYGNPLSHTHLLAYLNEDLYFADGQIKDEVYVYGSFVQSRMYRAGITCSNCHNPHSGELHTGSEPNDVCAQCHLPSTFATIEHSKHDSSDAACVDCHMASRTYMGVDDRRDHSFRVPRPDLSVEIGTPNACNGCHDDESVAWAATRVAEWVGTDKALRPHIGVAIAAGRKGGANPVLADTSANRDFHAIGRATALTLFAPPFNDADFQAVVSALGDADPLMRIAALRTLRGYPAENRLRAGTQTLNDTVRGVRIEAAVTFADLRDLLPAEASRAFGLAAEEYRAAQIMLANTPEALTNLGNFELASGDANRAAGHFQEALQLEPGFVPARLNLVDVLRQQGDGERASELLQQGILLSPENAALRHAMGLMLVRTNQAEAGLDELRKAYELDPSRPRYAYVLGVALNSLGQHTDALALLEEARTDFPADFDIGWALATMLRDAGKLDRARIVAAELAERFPDDANVDALRNSL
jgi:tetratricopeptide (TPR) repeat protein